MATANTCLLTICLCFFIIAATTDIATCWSGPQGKLHLSMCASARADSMSVSKQEAGPMAKQRVIQFVRFKSMSPRTIYLWELGDDEQLTSDSIPIAGMLKSIEITFNTKLEVRMLMVTYFSLHRGYELSSDRRCWWNVHVLYRTAHTTRRSNIRKIQHC
jgi:hypothetical protein